MSSARDSLRGLCQALGLGDDPERVLAEVSEVYQRVDEAVASSADGLDLPCRAGCDACCHEAVFVSAPEFLAVAAYLLETASVAHRRTVIEEMARWAAWYEDELALLDELTPGAERDEVAARVRFRCPLLGVDGRCTVYPVRELNARTFGMSRDEARDEPYGCSLTHQRLRVLPDTATQRLAGARAARRWLVDRVRGAEAGVHVYPWWFARYGEWLLRG